MPQRPKIASNMLELIGLIRITSWNKEWLNN